MLGRAAVNMLCLSGPMGKLREAWRWNWRSWLSRRSCILWMTKDARTMRMELDGGSFGYNSFTVNACLTKLPVRLTLSGSQWEHLNLMFIMITEGRRYRSKELVFEAILPFIDQIFNKSLQCVWHWAGQRLIKCNLEFQLHYFLAVWQWTTSLNPLL